MIKLLEYAINLTIIAGNFMQNIFLHSFNRYRISIASNMRIESRRAKVFRAVELSFGKKECIFSVYDFSEKVEQITGCFTRHCYYNDNQSYLIISNHMESVLREIAKQTNKISRILTKITEKYPQTASEIELALFAAIKIERTVTKCMESHNLSQSQFSNHQPNQYNPAQKHNNDPILDAAFKNIQSFKQSTSKLQSKINIMINETQSKDRRVFHKKHQQPNPKKQKTKQAKLIDDSFKQLDLQEPSQSMTELEKSINRISVELIKKLADKEKHSIYAKDEEEEQ